MIGKRLSGVADVRQRWRDCLDVLAASARQGDVTRRGATLQRGSAWCRSRCPRVIVPSWAASLSMAIAICARSSCGAPALFCSDQQTGRSIVLGCGSRLRRNAYTITSWHLRSPISGSDRLDCVGTRSQLRSARRAESCIRSVCSDPPMSKADPRRNRRMHSYTCRGLRVGLRRWRNGLAVASVIW